MSDSRIKAAQIFTFIPERFTWRAASLLDPVRELDHLVDRLLAVQPHDVVKAKLPALLFSFVRERRKEFGEHGNHHVRPALANERQRAVKIEQHMADARAGGESRPEFHGSHETAPS